MVNFLHTVAYLRKSRSDGDMTVEQVLLKHEQILSDFCIRTWGQVLSESQIYREVMSGESIESRPLFQKVLDLVKQGTVSAVLVVDLQRLSRGDLLEIGTISNIFCYSNVPIITPTHTYNLSDKYDRKIFEMEIMHGNDYLEYTKEILHRGTVNSAKQGNYMSTYAPFGYNKVFVNKKPTLSVDPLYAPVVREIYSRYIDGDSLTIIAQDLTARQVTTPRNKSDVWNRMTVYSILTNPTYTGKVTYGRTKQVKVFENDKLIKKYVMSDSPIVAVGNFEPIIDEETFSKVREKIGIPVKKDAKDLASSLSGLMRCGDCHKPMEFGMRNGVMKVRHMRPKGKCKCTEGKEPLIMKKVVEAIKHTIDNFEITNSVPVELVDYDTPINRYIKLRTDLLDKLTLQVITDDEYTYEKGKLNAEIDRLQTLKQKQQESIPKVTPEEYKLSLYNCLDNLDADISNKAKNKFMRSIIDCIYYTRDGADGDIILTILFK